MGRGWKSVVIGFKGLVTILQIWDCLMKPPLSAMRGKGILILHSW